MKFVRANSTLSLLQIIAALIFLPGSAMAQEVLPFKTEKSGTKAGVTMAASTYAPGQPERHLPRDANPALPGVSLEFGDWDLEFRRSTSLRSVILVAP